MSLTKLDPIEVLGLVPELSLSNIMHGWFNPYALKMVVILRYPPFSAYFLGTFEHDGARYVPGKRTQMLQAETLVAADTTGSAIARAIPRAS